MALALPALGPAVEFLDSIANPTVELRLARVLGRDVDPGEIRGRLAASSLVGDTFTTQHADGSWGDKDHPRKRLLPTLWMVKTLGELGLDKTHSGWMSAVDFLVEFGHTEGDVFSISGTPDGVLSCYIGIVGLIYLDGGLDDLAEPHLRWTLRYQEIRAGGTDRRPEPAEEWGPYLKAKYGGCMADTTCLVGLLREGRALARWGRPEAEPVLAAIREVFLERRLMFSSAGRVLPLAVSPKKAETWLEPSFPLDWRIDLIEAVSFVVGTGPVDHRLQPAVDKITEYQLADGTWPLRRAYRPAHLPGLENRSSRTGSPIVTLRVVEALHGLASAD